VAKNLPSSSAMAIGTTSAMRTTQIVFGSWRRLTADSGS
jgi:hypothetical protein